MTEWKTLFGRSGLDSKIAFSADGKLLASGTRDSIVAIWSVESGEVRGLSGHTGKVRSVSFSPDGKLLASASEDQTAKIWSTESGRELRSLVGHSGPLWDISFSPDGKLLASAGNDKTIRIWSTETWKELKSLLGHSEAVEDISFSPDGKLLASGGWDKTVRIWSVETGEEVKRFLKHSNRVTSLSFSPDGKLLASGTYGGPARIWSVEEGNEIRRLSDDVYPVQFSPDGKLLASGSLNTVTLWSTDSWTNLVTFKKSSTGILFLSFNPDGSVLASVNEAADWVTLWRLQAPPEIVLISPSSNRSVTSTGTVNVVALIKNVQDKKNVRMMTGQRGLGVAPATETTSEGIVLSWQVDVPGGANEFEIVAVNGIGQASKSFVVSYSGPPSKNDPKPTAVSIAQVWAVVIGISQYQKSELSLKYADRDAKGFFDFLRSRQGGSLPEDHISLIVNENATRENIIKAINDKLNRAFEEDLVIIYIACHGMPDPVGSEVYFLGYDGKPENLAGTAVSQLDIEKALIRTRAKKKLWIADACHSGGAGLAVRGNSSYLTNKLLTEMAASKEGLAVFTASSASEFSQENERWGGGHGVFTYHLIHGLEGGADGNGDGIVSIRELYEYVYRGVADETAGQQHPELKGTFDNRMPMSVVK